MAEALAAGIPGLETLKHLKDRVHEFTRERQRQFDEREKQEVAPLLKDGERDRTNHAMQRGRSMSHTQLMRKLKKLNPRLHFELAKNFPDMMGIYHPHPAGTYKGNLIHILGFSIGEVPEYGVMNAKGEIEKRGWQHILVDLIRGGLINKTRAEREFQMFAGNTSHNLSVLMGGRK